MVKRGLARGANGTRVVDVLAEICAEIDSGNHQVGRLGQKPVKGDDHRVRRRAFYGPLAFADVVADNWLPQGQRLRCSALLAMRRDNAQRGKSFEPGRERFQPGGVNSVVIGQQNVRHWQNVVSKIARVLHRKLRKSSRGKEEVVGTTGLEPATSRTPSVRATRLRYVPTAAARAEPPPKATR